MQFFLSMWLCLGARQQDSQGHFFLRFQLPWLQYPPRPRWLTHKLLLFPCLIPLLQHCGPPLNCAKDVVNTWPFLFAHDFCSTLPCTEAKKIEVHDSKVGILADWWAQNLSFFCSAIHSVSATSVPPRLQDGCYSGRKQQCPKAGMERERDFSCSFLSLSQEIYPSNPIGLGLRPNFKEAQKWSIWIFSFPWNTRKALLARTKDRKWLLGWQLKVSATQYHFLLYDCFTF